jgi:hypothetical protein
MTPDELTGATTSSGDQRAVVVDLALGADQARVDGVAYVHTGG